MHKGMYEKCQKSPRELLSGNANFESPGSQTNKWKRLSSGAPNNTGPSLTSVPITVKSGLAGESPGPKTKTLLLGKRQLDALVGLQATADCLKIGPASAPGLVLAH